MLMLVWLLLLVVAVDLCVAEDLGLSGEQREEECSDFHSQY